MKRGIIPVFVPHKGCPNDCVFCNQKRITGVTADEVFDETVACAQIDQLVAGVTHTFDVLELAFYGGSFTAIPEAEMMAYLKKAHQLKRDGKIQRIRLSTRPDRIDEAVVATLKAHGVDTVELGVQSLDSEVLRQAKRGCTAYHVEEAAKLLKTSGLELGFQLMVGLPGDSETKSLETAKGVTQFLHKPDFVRIYPALVIEDTEMADLYRSGHYTPFTLEQAVTVCAEMVETLAEAEIPVIRIGLQPSENMVLGKDILAGPFHPSFRQMVDTKLTLALLKQKIAHLLTPETLLSNGVNAALELSVPKKHMSTVKGLSKSGEIELKNWLKVQCYQDAMTLSIKEKPQSGVAIEDTINIKLMPSEAECNVKLPLWKSS